MRSSAVLVVLLVVASGTANAQTAARRIGGFAGYDGREERRVLGLRFVRVFPHRLLLFDRNSADLGLAGASGSAFGYLDAQRVIDGADDQPRVLLGIGVGLQIAERDDDSGFLVGLSGTLHPWRQEALSLGTRVIYGPRGRAPSVQLLLGLTFSRGPGVRIPRPPESAEPRGGL